MAIEVPAVHDHRGMGNDCEAQKPTAVIVDGRPIKSYPGVAIDDVAITVDDVRPRQLASGLDQGRDRVGSGERIVRVEEHHIVATCAGKPLVEGICNASVSLA